MSAPGQHTNDALSYDRGGLAALAARELAALRARTPRSAELLARARHVMPAGAPMSWMAGYYAHPQIYAREGSGSTFTDADGNRYIDMNVSDLSMTFGFGAPAIAEALERQYRRGAHFLLPTEDAIEVSEQLGRLTGMACWQFTLAASQANTEIIRIARHITGRKKLVVFEGKYHGHIDETLVVLQDGKPVPEYQGLFGRKGEDTIILPFNDPEALEMVLRTSDVALVLTEPALTNCALVLPDPGYLAVLRRLTRETGTLLAIDESHTFSFAHGGLKRAWSLDGDFLTLGKGFGSGVSFAAYGMSRQIGDHVERHLDILHRISGLALGGTLYGSALAMAAARAALEHVLTQENYAHAIKLGTRMADGIDQVCTNLSLPCRAFRLGPRSGLCLTPELPRNYREARRSMDLDMLDARRAYLANRGYWDCIVSAGPQASFAHNEAEIDGYVKCFRDFMRELCT